MTPTLGSVSHGTMRPQDLIPAFLSAIQEVAPDQYAQLMLHLPSEAPLDEDVWWNSEEASYLLEDLFDCLNDQAPPYVYFGCTEGDGSDYGYWICWDCILDAIEFGDIKEIKDVADIDEIEAPGVMFDYYLLDGKVLYEKIEGGIIRHWES